MKRRILKLLAVALSILMAASLTTGCGSSGTAAEAPAATEAASAEKAPETTAASKSEDVAPTAGQTYADTVYIAYPNDLTAVNPYGGTDASIAFYTNAVFCKLIKNDWETGETVGVLADSWEDVNGDGTAWRINLKKGIKFHDGTELDAEDVKFTWEYAKNIDNVVKTIPSADVMVKEVVVEDPYTVVFNCNYAIPDFPTYLEIAILSKDAYDTMDVAEAEKIGCGPYKVGKLVSGVSYAVERFDDYFEGIDNYPTKEFVFKVIYDDALPAALQSGEVDYSFYIPTASFNLLGSDPNLTTYKALGCQSFYIGMNYRHDVWNNVEMRQALAKAISKEDIVSVVFEDGVGASVNYNFCVPSGKGYADVNAITFDPDGAKELITKNGKEGMTVSIMTTANAKAYAEVVQANLQAVGLAPEIDIVDGTNWASLKKSGDYDIFVNDYASYSGALLYNFDRFFSVGGSSNLYDFASDEWEAMMADIRTCKTYEEMLPKFAAMQQWAADNVPIIPICINNSLGCADKNVGGIKLAPSYNLMEYQTVYKVIEN